MQEIGIEAFPMDVLEDGKNFVTLFLEEFGDHNDPSFASHELTSIKKNQNESVAEFNKVFNKVLNRIPIDVRPVDSFLINFYLSSFDSKTCYEILSHKPDTLQQAFKIAATIENNKKVVGKVAKRDDPKLYNSRVPKRDEHTQIMDILKNLKGKQNPNEKPPYRNNKKMNYNRPRLHDMPYNTN